MNIASSPSEDILTNEIDSDFADALKPRISKEMPGLAAVATHVVRNRPNEDACATGFALDEGGFAWPFLVVADGVGGTLHGGVASSEAVQAVAAALRGAYVPLDAETLEKNVRAAVEAAHNAVAETFEASDSPVNMSHQWSTTLIIAQETPKWLAVAYLGDGAIFHAPAEYVLPDYESEQLMPWRWRNLLSPHMKPHIENPDRLALERYVSGDRTYHPQPTIQLLAKDEGGDVLILCTDGVSSANDDTAMLYTAREGDNIPLVTVSPGILTFGETLIELWQEQTPPDSARIGIYLSNSLSKLRENPLVSNDDATVGVLLTRVALTTRWPEMERPLRSDLMPINLLKDTELALSLKAKAGEPLKMEDLGDRKYSKTDPSEQTIPLVTAELPLVESTDNVDEISDSPTPTMPLPNDVKEVGPPSWKESRLFKTLQSKLDRTLFVRWREASIRILVRWREASIRILVRCKDAIVRMSRELWQHLSNPEG